MANFPIDENQETLELELRKIETSDPVHADIYNALFQKLINNDAFLERLADKMIRQAMISHVLDSNNAGMVLGADVGPKITTITDGLQRALDVLNTKIANRYRYDFATSTRVDLSPFTTDSGQVYTVSCYGLLAVMCDGAGSSRGGHAQCRLTDLDGNMIMPCACTHPTSTSSNLCAIPLMPGYKISNVAVVSGTAYFYPTK